VALPQGLESVKGAQQLYDWFGYWPGFHDAEIETFHLDLDSPSSLIVHTWEMTSRVNAAGHYELTKHVWAEFILSGISDLSLSDLWSHSIILDLVIEKIESGFRLVISSAYGLSGTIETRELSLRIMPSPPNQK
jgi:hypothetical protein